MKPVVITVDSLQQKIKLYQLMDKYRKEKKRIKEEVSIFMSDFLPAEVKEQRRREREIYKANEGDQSTSVPMNITRFGLEIEGNKYQKKVVSPDSTKVLSYSEQHLEKICNTKLLCGEVIEYNGSKYVGVVLPTNNHQLINDVYMKLRLAYPQSKEIACAYSIPGLPCCYHEDYCDDRAAGTGNFLLKVIQKNKITCMAVFTVRIQYGPNPGTARFEVMEKAVKNALDANPFNKYVNATQQIEITERQPNNEPNPRGARGNTRQIRGSLPGKQHVVRGGYEGESFKRRRQDAFGTERRRSNSPPYNFQHQVDTNFKFAPPGETAFASSLGDSWPTLKQSTVKRK